LQLTKDNGGAILLRQTVKLPVQEGQQLRPEPVLGRFRLWFHGLHLNFAGAAFDGRLPGLASGLVGHAIKPVGQQLGRTEARRLAEQDQESSLKGVLSIIVVREIAAANAPDHRGMTPHQRFQRHAVPAHEPTQ
jgi:hypothetical protein